jgi:hypothetical protein
MHTDSAVQRAFIDTFDVDRSGREFVRNALFGFKWFMLVYVALRKVRSFTGELLMASEDGATDQADDADRADSRDREWESKFFAGFEALVRGHRREAAECWIRARATAASMQQSDPRAAAAENNCAVGHLLLSPACDVGSVFNGALTRWELVRRHALAMEVPVVGASSVFHLKLAMSHHDAFRETRRQYYVRLCEAAMAITSFNARLLGGEVRCDPSRHSVDDATITRLAAAFGDRCPEISIIRKFEGSQRSDVPPFAEYRGKVERIRNLQVPSLSGSFSVDCRNLELAAHLTVLLDPTLLRRDR